jgi:hypothetical protein
MALTGTVSPPATSDGKALTLVPIPRRRKAQLNTLEGVRIEMARQYREMEAGKRDPQDGSKLVYVLAAIGKILELTEIERRLRALEDKRG